MYLLLVAVGGVLRPPGVDDLADTPEAVGLELERVLDALRLQGAAVPNGLRMEREE